MIEITFEELRLLGLTPAIANQVHQAQPAVADHAQLMRVVETQRDWFTLHDGHVERQARSLHALTQWLQARDAPLTIGDWVLAQVHDHGELWIAARLPPATQIARRANDGRRQPLASNVDTALLVMGLDDDYNPRRMERYVALVRASGVAPVAVLTKADIGRAVDERVAQLRQRLPASVPMVAVNALSDAARESLLPWLGTGQTLVLLGSSGAGKSTLTNTLTGDAGQLTGGVRRGDGRGRHTTTARSLHFCADGTCIIDTPGLRTWRPDADAEVLASTYDDIAALAVRCQFRDCRHAGEPGCAVRDAVDDDRLLNYQKLLRDAERSDLTPLQRIAIRSRWKAMGKAGEARAREKRG